MGVKMSIIKTAWNWLCSWNLYGFEPGSNSVGIVASLFILAFIFITIDVCRGKKSILF